MILLDYAKTLTARIQEKAPLIQVILGPRQVGKTTTIQQIIENLETAIPCHYASADAVFLSDWTWIERQWILAEALGPQSLLVLDEIQKIENWSEVVKKLWDENKRRKVPIKVVLLGSSSLALQTGLSESLTGRFELMRFFHWNWGESSKAFSYSLDEYLLFGGYPGTAPYRKEEQRWLDYMRSSIVETVLEKDILQLNRIARPALFKQVFELLCSYPAEEISLRKLTGQLQDPGAIETIKHYIEILAGAFLVTTLQKFSTNPLQKKSSSPKILPLAPALCTFVRGDFQLSSDQRGRIFELAVGLDLLRVPGDLFYWRQDQIEVDYVLRRGRVLVAIEVKSGRKKSPHGLIKFKEHFPHAQLVMVTPEKYQEFSANPWAFIQQTPM